MRFPSIQQRAGRKRYRLRFRASKSFESEQYRLWFRGADRLPWMDKKVGSALSGQTAPVHRTYFSSIILTAPAGTSTCTVLLLTENLSVGNSRSRAA